MLAVVRHGDRTPKQKMKVTVTQVGVTCSGVVCFQAWQLHVCVQWCMLLPCVRTFSLCLCGLQCLLWIMHGCNKLRACCMVVYLAIGSHVRLN